MLPVAILLAPFVITDGTFNAELRVRQGAVVGMTGMTPAVHGQPHGQLMKRVVIRPRCCPGGGSCDNVISLYDLRVKAGGTQTFFLTKSEPGAANLSLTYTVGLGKQAQMVALCKKGGPGTRSWPVSMSHRYQCRDTSAVFGSGKSNFHKIARTLHVNVVCEPPPRRAAPGRSSHRGVGVRVMPAGGRPDPAPRDAGCRADRECARGQRCGRDHRCYTPRRHRRRR